MEILLILHFWGLWWYDSTDKLPAAVDQVQRLIVDGRTQMTDCCFKEVVSTLEKAYWKMEEGEIYEETKVCW